MRDQEKNKEDRVKGYYKDMSNTNNRSYSFLYFGNKSIRDEIVNKISSRGKSKEDNNVYLSESAQVSNNVRGY